VVAASSISSSEGLRRFLLRCAAFAALSTCVWTLCTAVFFNGYTDDFYLRVASPRQASLILGTSRAAQALVPSEIDARALGLSPPYNYAFTSATSRYGAAYLRAIRGKLAAPAPGELGLYLVEVSALAVSIDSTDPPSFPENETFIGKLHSYALQPNVEYPFYAADRGYAIIDRSVRRWRAAERLTLHADGWLEVRPVDEADIAANIEKKLAEYGRLFERSRFSPERFEYLERTLGLLAPRGRLGLVVVPIDPRLRALEHAYLPDFDARLRALAARSGATYFDLSDLDASVLTNDGNHVQRDSARAVSRELSTRLARAWGNAPAAR
jgi:hypothetical protein